MSVRTFVVPLSLGLRRVLARPGAFALAGAGIALAACALATVSAASLVVQDRAVSQALEELSPPERAVEVTWIGPSGSGSDRHAVVDRQVRARLDELGLRRPFGVMLYRDARLEGTLVRVGAVDGLARAVRLTSGRPPRPCRTAPCEVLAIGSAPATQAPGLRVTGRGTLRTGAAGAFFAGAASSGRLLLAEGVDGLSRLPQLAFSFRTYEWIAPLRSADVRAWELDDFRRGVVGARSDLQARSFRYDLKAPVVALEEAGSKARIASRRLLLVGGQVVVMLLAFVLLAASRLRRGARAAARRLEWSGGTWWQVRLAALAEAGVVAVPATVLGWMLGAVGASALAAFTDTPVGAVVAREVVSPRAALLALAIAAAATLVLYLGARAKPIAIGGTGISVLDVAAVGAVVAVVVAFAAGGADAESLASSSGTGLVLLLLPGLIALAASVVLARLLFPGLRLAERMAPRRWLGPRLALLSLARSPGTATVAVVFVSLSVGLAVFASTYRSTLLRNGADRAGFDVPLDYDVRRDPSLAGRPPGAPPVGAAYATRFDAVPVVRREGEVPSLERRKVAVLGVPADALTRLRWRDDFANEPPEQLAERLGGTGVVLRGVPIPLGARELRLPVTVRGESIRLSANIRAREGAFLVADLGEPATNRPTVQRARLPSAAGGGLLIGLNVEFPSAEEATASHRAAEGASSLDVFRAGLLRLGRPRAVGRRGTRPLPIDYREWVGPDGTRPPSSATPGSIDLRYLLTQEQGFRLRPRQQTDGGSLPVIASESLANAAGRSGTLPVYVGTARVNVRIAATARLFPSTSGDFVVADRGRLEAAVNSAVPGSALADEAWVSGPAGLGPRLERAGPVPVDVRSRRALEAELRADPLARGSLLILAASGALALALSLVGLALTLAVDLRDEAGELVDLETQGVGPSGLRRHLRLRAAAVVLAGLVGGLAIGTVLTLAVLEALAVSANSTEPVPPLVLEPDWAVLAVAFAAFLALTVAAAVGVTRTAFRAESA
ncbi:MAG TPA: FtsX-like permease family protein [Gaiellaceae bacterium]|nr:FtsX-like permease family protein [Gaiellaceae bacterium]